MEHTFTLNDGNKIPAIGFVASNSPSYRTVLPRVTSRIPHSNDPGVGEHLLSAYKIHD